MARRGERTNKTRTELFCLGIEVSKVRVIHGKITVGNKFYFQLARDSSYRALLKPRESVDFNIDSWRQFLKLQAIRRFELPKVKITVKMIKCYFEFARDSRFRAPKVSGVDCSIDPGLQFLNLKSIRYSSNSSHDITREHYVMEKTRYVGRDREIREAISTCLSDFESRLITKHKQHRANICVSFILLPQN